MEKPVVTELGVTANELLEEYKIRVNELTYENTFLRAYIKRIEKELKEVKSKDKEWKSK
ncbi:hypothetical protein [Collinsella aerofaciens]|uniref:hypothetical protein n=1 Tax=Collinsella aerofaciens TaxID=74426 RepID=UPI001D03068D|nr:hypothetical protein [Collinsella aerofaciens]MCB5366909.1 hypothetical protein [Collinsella aerofaciens]MCB5368966.1 hypothetical protein [Collinsella aerofaciens]